MNPPATPKRLPSHIAVSSDHAAIGKASGKDVAEIWYGNCIPTPAIPKWLPSHAVNSAHATFGKTNVRTL